MKQILLILLFIFGALSISRAQEVVANSDRGYYIKDNKIVSGIAIEKANRTQRSERLIIPNQVSHPAAVLYPGDIEEYGFDDVRRYISAEIILQGNPKKVFLEELMNLDTIVVYSYPTQGTDLFFLQKGNSLPELIQDEKEFWDLFRNPLCPEITEFINFKKKAKLDYGTMSLYRRAYSDCNTNLFPKFRMGITTEAGGLKPGINKYTEYTFDWDFSFLAGLFVQIPLDECFSFRPELLYSYIHTPKSQISGTVRKSIGSKSYIVRESFQFPLVFRYNFNYTRGKIIPYVDLGLLLDVKWKAGDNIAVWNNETKSWWQLAGSKESRYQYGGVLGGGVEYKFSPEHSLYAGIRFKYIQGDVRNEYVEQLKYITFNIAYGFSVF
jgi:hypothetical protein